MGKAKYLIFILFGFLVFILGTQKTQAADADVVINEVMANAPTPETELEWVELYNAGDVSIDLKNWTFDGKIISVDSLLLDSGKYLILARDADAFKIQWPNVTVLVNQISISLANSSDMVVLKNADGTYQEEFSWNTDSADNISWERIDSQKSSDDNWLPSDISGGTPGEKNSVANLTIPLSPTLLSPKDASQIANTDNLDFNWEIQLNVKYEFILSKENDFNDYIFDEKNLLKGEFAANNLEPGIYYWKVIASNILGEIRSEVFSFEILPPSYSSSIIINEFYPDSTTGEEWIELYNNSAEDVNLKDWVLEDLKGSICQYKIDQDLVISAFGYLAILKSKSGITLNNDADGVRLVKPDGEILYETPVFVDGDKGWSFARNSVGVWQWTTKITPELENIILAPVVEEESDNDNDTEEDIPVNSIPEEIKTGTIKDYENHLVKITGTVVETSGNTFYLDDGSGKAKVYIQAATGIDKPEMHSGDIFEVTGIVNCYRNVFRILPQKQEDIKLIKAKKEEDTESEVSTTKKSTAKSSAVSTVKAAATTAKVRAPTKQIASNSSNNIESQNTQIEGYQSPFWVEIIKALVGLIGVFLIVLLIKIWRLSANGQVGRNFGDDET
ncbi:MAG: lamin tail domain-containing protein [Patescibacteria group bacterium]